MKAELKAKWIAALRSGKYPQARKQLRTVDGRFCCLGVLCEVAGIQRVESPCGYVQNGYGYVGSLPTGLIDDDNIESSLVAKNDIAGATFADIADWIDAHIPTDGEAA